MELFSFPALFQVCWTLKQAPGNAIQFISAVLTAGRGLPQNIVETFSLTCIVSYAKKTTSLSHSVTSSACSLIHCLLGSHQWRSIAFQPSLQSMPWELVALYCENISWVCPLQLSVLNPLDDLFAEHTTAIQTQLANTCLFLQRQTASTVHAI